MRAASEADRHAVFDNELHQVLLYRRQKSLAGVFHQRNHQLEDFGHVANHHEDILRLKQHEDT